MITYSVAAFLLTYLKAVQGQATICLATYGGVATSVPPPGRDFIVQVSPYLSPFDPGDPGSGFLDSTGQLQSLCQKSSTFVLSSGLLYSGGDRVSVAPGMPFVRFEASKYVEAIDSIFAVDEAEGRMVWNNEEFEDGTARFCADPTGALYGIFLGSLPGNCTATELRVQNPDSCPSLPKPLQVLPTLLGNQTSLAVPTASINGPLSHLQPQLQLGNQTSLVVPTASMTGPPRQLQPQPQIGNQTSLVVPTASVTGPLRQLQPQPQLQQVPASSSSTLNSSLTASSLASPFSSPSSSSSTLPITSSSSSNSPTSSLISSTSPSVTTSSATSTGSFVALTTFTMTSASTTSVSSSSTTLESSLEDPIAQASSIISQDRLTIWCTDVLGYTTPPQITVTIVSNVSATTIMTTRPSNDTTTNPTTLTSTATQTVPSFNITILTTPTVTDIFTTTDEVIVTETTTVLGPSLGDKRRGLPFLPGKPFPIDEQQPRLIGTSYSTASAVSNSSSASSGTLLVSSHATLVNGYAISASNNTSLASNYTSSVSSYAMTVRRKPIASLNATASINATSAISNATGLRTITTPVILQTYDPSIINAACSQNAVMPTPLPNVTTSIITTFVFTDYIKLPYATLDTTYIVPINTTINNGNYSTTVTETPITNDITDVATTTSTITSSVVTFPSNVPTLILTSGTPIAPAFSPDGALPPDIDDAAWELTLPFQMRMFDHSSEIVWVSSNGILSLDNGTREYDNECLPSIGNEDYPNDPVPPYSAFPYWDDTYIYAGQPQGIYYQYGDGPQNNINISQSNAPATNITFEYYLSHCCGSGDGGNEKYYHYTVFYDSLSPGVFTYKYYQISENGISATVGIQDYLADTAITYSCNEAVITPGLEVVLNSIIGTVSHSNFSTTV